VIGWAIEALAASTLLMLVVLALRGPVARRFGAQAAYLLWLLPALRMILPRLPKMAEEPVQAMPIHFDIARIVAAATTPAHPAAATAASPVDMSPPSIDWLPVALPVWLGGAAVYLAWQLGRHHRFMSIALEHANAGFLRGGIKVRLSPVVTGPLAAGIFHRHILLPEDFEQRYNGAEQRLALAHELAHHRRGDLIANGAALVMLALHWFNPIAHWAYRAFRNDQELACDATVLGASPESGTDYGRALIKSARAGMAGTAACALGPTTELKRRIMMIAHSTRSRAHRIAGVGLATVLVGLGLGLTASGSIAAPSKIAPKSIKPLLQVQATPQPAPAPQAIVIADRTTEVALRTSGNDHDQADAVAPPTAPVAPRAPLSPVSPVAPIAPLAPLPPLPPMNAKLSAEQRDQIREAARLAGEQARQAGEAVREASEAARQAGEAARLATANIDFAAISREAMGQARAELEQTCKHATPAPPGETDSQAISRLAMGCVDMAAINREVQASLRDAMEEIRRDRNISNADRARALAAIDKTRAEMTHRFTQ
jgi:beta-lactamase regulating signal transducer with metallopeptidase domain